MLFESFLYKCNNLFQGCYETPCIFLLPRTKIFISTAGGMQTAHKWVPQVFPFLCWREMSYSRLCSLLRDQPIFSTLIGVLTIGLFPGPFPHDSKEPSQVQWDPRLPEGSTAVPLFPLPNSESLMPPFPHSHTILFLRALWINLLFAIFCLRIGLPGHLM